MAHDLTRPKLRRTCDTCAGPLYADDHLHWWDPTRTKGVTEGLIPPPVVLPPGDVGIYCSADCLAAAQA